MALIFDRATQFRIWLAPFRVPWNPLPRSHPPV